MPWVVNAECATSLVLRCCTAAAWLTALVVCSEIDEVVTGLVLDSVNWVGICMFGVHVNVRKGLRFGVWRFQSGACRMFTRIRVSWSNRSETDSDTESLARNYRMFVSIQFLQSRPGQGRQFISISITLTLTLSHHHSPPKLTELL